jgi:CBS domain-containing protein
VRALGWQRGERPAARWNSQMSIKEVIGGCIVGQLDLAEFATAEDTTPVVEVLRRMRACDSSTTLVTRDDRLVGIFTERDVLKKVVNRPERWELPVRELMTPNPVVVTTGDSVLGALRLMNEGKFRDLPVVDATGKIIGNLTDNAVVRHLGDHLQAEVLNLPPDPNQVAESAEGA